MTVSTYPATCGGCMTPVNDKEVAHRIRLGRKVVCERCGKVFHHGGTMAGAIRTAMAIRAESDA